MKTSKSVTREKVVRKHSAERRDNLRSEMEAIRKRGRGTLKPEAVVKYAQGHPGSALAEEFDFADVNKAAMAHWVWQARQLIVEITVVVDLDSSATRHVYVSLTSDRHEPGGGYRDLDEVLTKSSLRKQLVGQVVREFASMRSRYSYLRGEDADLDTVFRAIDAMSPVATTKLQRAANK